MPRRGNSPGTLYRIYHGRISSVRIKGELNGVNGDITEDRVHRYPAFIPDYTGKDYTS